MFQDAAEKAVRSICMKLPTTMNQQCKEFMEKYDDIIVDLLFEAVAPSEMCSLMMLCRDKLHITKC